MTNLAAVSVPEPSVLLGLDVAAIQPAGALVSNSDERQEDVRSVQVARAFFEAATRLSDDNEDILPQVLLLLMQRKFLAINIWRCNIGGCPGPQAICLLSIF